MKATASRLLRLPLGLFVLAVTALWAAETGGLVDLKSKWIVGQRHVNRITMQQEQEITGSEMPSPMKQQTHQVQEFATTVKQSRPGGGHELQMEYTRMQLESRMGDTVALSFDSSKPSSEDGGNPAAGMFRALVGARFLLLTDARGQVTAAQGVKELIQKIGADLPPMFSGMLEGMVNEDSLKQVSSAAQGLPDRPVKVGDTWPFKQETSLGPLGKLGVDMTLVFKGWETRQGRRCALLEHTGALKSVGEPGTNAFAITRLSGTTRGQAWFDAEVGVMRESVAVQKMDVKMRAMGQELSTVLSQTVTNELIGITGSTQ